MTGHVGPGQSGGREWMSAGKEILAGGEVPPSGQVPEGSEAISSDQDRLTSRRNLAYAYQQAGRLNDAIPLYERNLAESKRNLGDSDPVTLTTRDNLAAAYGAAGRFGEAIPLLEQVLADRERILGQNHPDALTFRSSLAYAYRKAGRLAEAIALLERTLADSEAILGENHPFALASRNNLAAAYQAAGRLSEAISLYERTVAECERMLGESDPGTLTCRSNLARAYQQAGRLDEAIALLEHTLTDHERIFGQNHPSILASRDRLAGASRAARHLDKGSAQDHDTSDTRYARPTDSAQEQGLRAGRPARGRRTSSTGSTSRADDRKSRGGRARHQEPPPGTGPQPGRGERGDGDWPSSEWEGLSDVDYWAELASDKPLTSTTQPVASPATPDGAPSRRGSYSAPIRAGMPDGTDPRLAAPKPAGRRQPPQRRQAAAAGGFTSQWFPASAKPGTETGDTGSAAGHDAPLIRPGGETDQQHGSRADGGSYDWQAGSSRGGMAVPAAEELGEQNRLPIFEAVESDWFRRDRPAVGWPSHRAEADSSWTSPADEVWRTPGAVDPPSSASITPSGLPKRVPAANLTSERASAADESSPLPSASSAASRRERFAAFQRGARQGHAASGGSRQTSVDGGEPTLPPRAAERPHPEQFGPTMPDDHDPLTSPSFPSVTSYDSRSYRQSPPDAPSHGPGARGTGWMAAGLQKRLERFLVAQLPARVPQSADLSLTVRVSTGPEAFPAASSAGMPGLEVGEDGAPVTVAVQAPRHLIPLGELEQVIWVPAAEDSLPVRFAFRAHGAGLQRVLITAWAGGTFLAELALEVSVEAGAPYVDAPARTVPVGIVQAEPGEVTLQVRFDGERYTFQLLSQQYLFEPVLAEAVTAEPGHALEQMIGTLRAMAMRGNTGGYSPGNARRWMERAGVGLWNDMVPELIKEQFWQLQGSISSFSVAVGRDVVQWELLYPLSPGCDEGFLVEQFPVMRRVYGQQRSRMVMIGNAKYVVPVDSPANAMDEISKLQQIVDLRDGEAQPIRDLGVLLAHIESGHAGLLHFACHNTFAADRGGPAIAMGGEPFVPLLLNKAVTLGTLAPSHPLIFINACRSASVVPEYTHMMGWAEQFMAAGAGAFAGTLWAVRSESASAFAQAFYGELVSGRSLGQACMSARVAAACDASDPTWLAYTVYGDPAAVAVRQ